VFSLLSEKRGKREIVVYKKGSSAAPGSPIKKGRCRNSFREEKKKKKTGKSERERKKTD